MTQFDDLMAAAARTDARTADIVAPPSRRLAVVTCMDARIDVFGLFGLDLGEAHVLRNAGARVTDDLLRSLALSSWVLGVERVALVQHTGCGLEGVTNADLQARTGADLEFLPIADHAKALEQDVQLLATTPYLSKIRSVAGLLYDLTSGAVTELSHWERTD